MKASVSFIVNQDGQLFAVNMEGDATYLPLDINTKMPDRPAPRELYHMQLHFYDGGTISWDAPWPRED